MRQYRVVFAFLTVLLLVTACASGRADVPATPTRTPKPTFTPVPVSAAPGSGVQPGQTTASAQPTVAVIPPTPTPEPPTPTPEPPTPTPTPKPFAVVNADRLNVRAGPDTAFTRLTQIQRGERYRILASNPDRTWWMIRLKDDSKGWVYGELVTVEGPVEGVRVAKNIPTPPPTPTPRPRPTATPVPPTPTPAPRYTFNKALLQNCAPNAGVTYVNGTVYYKQSPANGYWVAFSYAPDGPIVAKVMTGPHEGYPNWNDGFYSHILKSDGPREGDWYFWIVDETGKRISEIAYVHTDGTAGPGKCQQAVIDFDTN